jgi:hypothetical protein
MFVASDGLKVKLHLSGATVLKTARFQTRRARR